MKYNPSFHHRQSLRLPGYDYSQAGVYFVTIDTHQRAQLFGEIIGGRMVLNRAGKLVQQMWGWVGQRFPGVEMDVLGVMPDHIHGVIVIHTDRGAADLGQTGEPSQSMPRPCGPAPGSLGAIVGQFKSRVTKRLWQLPELAGNPVWHRNYYEHIIRDVQAYEQVCQYIESNPSRWKGTV